MPRLNKAVSVVLVIVLCFSVSQISSLNGSYSLSAGAESAVVGGASDCHDFTEGFAVGMGVALLFGCAWCGVVAVGAKVVGLFC